MIIETIKSFINILDIFAVVVLSVAFLGLCYYLHLLLNQEKLE